MKFKKFDIKNYLGEIFTGLIIVALLSYLFVGIGIKAKFDEEFWVLFGIGFAIMIAITSIWYPTAKQKAKVKDKNFKNQRLEYSILVDRMIDEATRERFLFPYKEHNVTSTVDFVKRAIAYFGYAPETIQTDNGGEFTNVKKPGQKEPVKHILDIFLEKIKISHQLIRAYTPRLNGKVERSHRSDQESFYNYLTFKTYDELKKKMMKWNIRYNNRPHSSLRNREGKKVWWTPLEKREDLLKLLQEKKDEFNIVRFVKIPKTIKQVYAV